VLGRYTRAATVARDDGRTAEYNHQNSMAGIMVIAVAADFLGLICWAWLAMATRRGHGWTRVAGTVLLGIYTIITLLVLFGSHRDPGAQFTTVVVWALGVATVIPLYSQQAREFVFNWRRR